MKIYHQGEEKPTKGFIRKNDGYRMVTFSGKQILEHRYILEKALKRNLLPEEIVHHINEDKLDNRIENLQIITRSEHKKIHKEIGLSTRLKKIYDFNAEEIIALYKKHKNTIVIARIVGCHANTIERFIKQVTGYTSLRIYARENNWKYGYR